MVDKDTCEWELLSTSKKQTLKFYDCCTEAYPTLDFDFTMQRKSSLYTGIVFPPALGTSFKMFIMIRIKYNCESSWLGHHKLVKRPDRKD